MLINWSLTSRGRPRRSKHLPTHLRLTIPLTGPLMTNQRHERLDCFLMGRIYECTSLLSLQGCKPVQWKRWSTAIVAAHSCEFKSSFLWAMSKIPQAKYKRRFEVINIRFSSGFLPTCTFLLNICLHTGIRKMFALKTFQSQSIKNWVELSRTTIENWVDLGLRLG